MAGISKYSVIVILLTICALFIVTMSLTMFWYQYSDANDGTTRLAVDYYETERGLRVYWGASSVSTIMVVLQVMVVLWFLAALVFIGLLTSGNQIDALKTTPVLVILSVGMLVYFVLRIPDAVNWWPSPDPRLSGFFSSTGGPTAGFFVALLACGLQVSASILYVQFLRRGEIEM